MVVPMPTGRWMGMVERVFVKVQVCVAANARDMGREVGRSFTSLQHVSSQLAGFMLVKRQESQENKSGLTRLSSMLVFR